jgi:hypothetical protein
VIGAVRDAGQSAEFSARPHAARMSSHDNPVENPRTEAGFDTEPKMGVEPGLDMLDKLVANKMDTRIYHMAWPGVGAVVENGVGNRFVAKPRRVAP